MKTITTQYYAGQDSVYNLVATLSGKVEKSTVRSVPYESDSTAAHEKIARELAYMEGMVFCTGFDPVVIDNGYIFLVYPKD